MNRNIKIIFPNSVIIKTITSDEELTQYFSNLSIFINISYLRKTIVRVIKKDFFYFSDSEQKLLMDIVIKSFDSDIASDYIYNTLVKWFKNNNSLNIDGFVMFRLKEYYRYIFVLVQEAAEQFIAELEKMQIISYFRNQLREQVSYLDTVYVYSNNNRYKILNQDYETIIIINNCEELLLNIIISIAPANIYFYGKCENPIFFDTLLSVFENRIKVMN